jgi:hypothetical protein
MDWPFLVTCYSTPPLQNMSGIILVAWRIHASNGIYATPPLGYYVLMRYQKHVTIQEIINISTRD